jgi:rhomboid protease GluP
MCPNCRAFITVTDRVCPYCDAQVGPRAVDMRGGSFVASFMPRANVTSIVILALNVIFFIGQSLSSGLTNAGVEFAPFVFGQHQWWRLITAGFLHGGILHIAMNSWSLWILVTEVEQFYGTARLIVAYVASTITGFLLAALMTPRSPVLGASCAAFGLMGTMLAMGLRSRADPLAQAVRSHYGNWLVFGLLMSVGGGISLSGHVGGFLGGLAVGFIAGLPGLPGTPKETVWKMAAGLAVTLVIAAWLKAVLYLVSAYGS